MGKDKKPEASVSMGENHCLLMNLPAEMLNQVLDMLSADDLRQLLQTSKVMAVEVMQHSAGRITYKLSYRNFSLSGARWLLQWAPPACLKLQLVGCDGHKGLTAWGALSSLFHYSYKPSPASSGVQTRQYLCVLEVCIMRFLLPGLVPVGLATMCPNMHTLHLCGCTVKFRSNGTSADGKASSGGACSSMGASCVTSSFQTRQLHTLILTRTHAPQLRTKSHGNSRQYTEQLRHSIPNVTCLNLNDDYFHAGVDFVPTVGPQLKDFQVAGEGALSKLQKVVMASHLQQLQKLVLPHVEITAAADVSFLISLPSLNHLEVDSVTHKFSGDYSSHACKWQYLHLHLHGKAPVRLRTLAKLPLHSLTQPLTLGHELGTPVYVCLPSSNALQDIVALQQLANKLIQCGVRLLGLHLAWSGPLSYASTPGARCAPAFAIFAPAFGPQITICISSMIVDQPILDALATMYGSSLQCLTLNCIDLKTDIQATWHAVLTTLPSISKLDLHGCYSQPGYQYSKQVAQGLTAAMKQQPAGRRMELVLPVQVCTTPDELITHVMKGTPGHTQLSNLEVTARRTSTAVCLCISSKHMH